MYPDENDLTVREFQASSPDEIALVRFADSMGMKLIERDQNLIKIANTTGTEENYEVLANFPFSSDTKRMGIVLRQRETGKIIFYLKGAEVVIGVAKHLEVVFERVGLRLADPGALFAPRVAITSVHSPRRKNSACSRLRGTTTGCC